MTTRKSKLTTSHLRLAAIEPLEARRLLAAPVANADTVLVRQATATPVTGLLLNDTDADGNTLALVGNTNPANGGLVSDGTGGFIYTPNSGFAGNDSFTYSLSDGTSTVTGQVKLVVSVAMDAEAARTQILAGVTNLFDPTDPRRIAAFGQDAYVIAKDSAGGPMIGAATWGAGRVIAMNDHQWLEMSREPGSGSTSAALAENGIGWLANNTAKSIKIVTYLASNTTWLQARGFTNVVTATSANLATQLSGAKVFFAGWLGSSVSQSTIDTIGSYVRGGGGLYITDYGPGYSWWWGLPYYNAPGNKLLRDAGLGFGDSGGVGLTAVRATDHIDSAAVFNMLDGTGTYTSGQRDEGGQLLDALYDILPPTDSLTAQLNVRYNAKINTINPTPATPVPDVFDRALLNHEATVLQNLPAAQVTKHRTVDAVYGAVPAGAPRVTRTVGINTGRTRWIPTGLYAAPGELVTLTLPAALVNKGYTIEINAHTDWVSRTTLERLPYVHRSFTITSTSMQVACAFGGSIFINLGGDNYSSPPNLGVQNVTIANAVEQPYFVLGQNTDAEWNTTLRARQAPYGVLVSENLMVVLSKAQIESANLTTPTALMTWWNGVVAGEDWLAYRSTPRTGAEIINVDVQQSAGSAHSGYPIQAYQKYWDNMADYATLAGGGSWGNFHELGHNHQRGWWTFDSGGEVTVNIFSNYAQETMASSPASGGWGWGSDPVQVMTTAKTTVADTTLAAWENKNQYAFYFQLADGFGWDKYRQVLRSYELDNASNPSALPTTNQQEKDQWLIRWSQATGYNLVNYMVNRWKLEVSAAAVAQVNALGLPDWLPAIGGLTKASVVPGNSVTLDLAGQAISYDGVSSIANVSGAAHGTLIANGNGTWTYTPAAGYRGSDSFTYDAVSSTGYAIKSTVAIAVGGARLETWTNITGSAVSNLTSSAKYIANTPDTTTTVGSMETPSNRLDNYGDRLRAFLIPPTTGDYTFWIASDDAGELWLSTNSIPANTTKIAYVSGYTGVRSWDANATQKSATISLVAGQKYYIQALHKEGGGADHLSVAWSGPGIARDVISGAYLDPIMAASVAGRAVFYNNSSYDGNSAAAGAADDAAIAPDKTALLPGQTATGSNFTNYDKGINGIMVDIANLPANLTPTAADFAFLAGTAADPNSWTTVPVPTSVTLRRGAGAGRSDRVTILFADGSLSGVWLRATVKATAATGLAAQDVFYFGNAPGDADFDGTVGLNDLLRMANAYGQSGNWSNGDFDGDGQVALNDLLIMSNRYGISLPMLTQGPVAAAAIPPIDDLTPVTTQASAAPLAAIEPVVTAVVVAPSAPAPTATAVPATLAVAKPVPAAPKAHSKAVARKPPAAPVKRVPVAPILRPPTLFSGSQISWSTRRLLD